ncbi:TerB N-terminal domain-containing protein [Bacillus songklensis]|uniref:TerB N-terminal domain-containing protein n=1 Tax=Bacillus songklensis TaxID=1069116 RepID=A0ABV8B562_9BACI
MFFRKFFGLDKKKPKPRAQEEAKKRTIPLKPAFYNEEEVILDEFKHLRTPQKILHLVQEVTKPSQKRNYGNYEINYSYNTSAKEFVKASLANRNRTHPKCRMPPFQQYYSTFSDMNKEQQNWYFYWRERVLNGEYLSTDLSYIYVFVYELINYSFNPKASFNVSMLARLYEAYKEQHHSKRFEWLIGDLLYELGENELAEKWSPYTPQIPPLYKQLKEKENDLARISITYWKGYLQANRDTKFYSENKNKVYKTFKDCIHLLEEHRKKETGKRLINLYFETKDEQHHRYLLTGMVSLRDYHGNYVTLDVQNIHPTPFIYKDVSAFFRLAENVTRLLNGEKRQLQIEEGLFPDGLKEEMVEYMSKPKEKTRFKTVKKKEKEESGSAIPPKPEKHPRVIIEFDDERIKALSQQSDELVQEVENRASEYENEDKFIEVGNDEEKEKKQEKTATTVSNPTPSGLDHFFSSGGEIDEEEIQEFVGQLGEVEKEFLKQFNELEWSKAEAVHFLKSKGKMPGVFLSEMNEKAQEILEDNLIQDEGENLVIYEEFESIITMVKER